MPDDRSRHPRRPGAGRRPPYVAGHRRRDVDDTALLPTTETFTPAEETDESLANDLTPNDLTSDEPPTAQPAADEPDAGTGETVAASAAADLGEPVQPPQQIRVASTGWPESAAESPAEPPAQSTVDQPVEAPVEAPAQSAAEQPVDPPVEKPADSSLWRTLAVEEPAPGRETDVPPVTSEVDAPSAAPEVDAQPAPEGLTSPPLHEAPWAGLSGAQPATSWTTSVPAAQPDAEPAPPPETSLDAPEPTAQPLPPTDGAPAPADVATDTTPTPPVDLATPAAESATTAAESAAPSDGDVVPADSGRSRWRTVREVLLVTTLVAVLALGGLNLWFHVLRSPGNRLTDASAKAAAAAAATVAVPLLSYDYRTIDQQTAKLAKLQTTTCATQYANVIKTVVMPLATQNQAILTSQVLAVGVRSASAKTVSVLAFVQLTSSNKAKPTKEINEIQLTLTMVEQHGSWLLASTSADGSGTSTASC